MSLQNAINESPFKLREGDFIEHYLLKYDSIQAREYQVELTTSCLKESTVVALPTGTGKTIVSLLTAAERLHSIGGRVLFLAPLKPLVQQQADSFKEHLDIKESEITVFTGDVRPAQREQLWDGDSKAIFATPQVIENDIVAGRISLEDVSHITFDECHRATGDYSYTFIAEEYWNMADNPLVTGLSASPGTNKDDIISICENIGATNLEVVSEEDESLQKHLFETTIRGEFITLPEDFKDAKTIIETKFRSCTEQLKEDGYLSTVNPRHNELRHGCRKKIQKDANAGDKSAYASMSVYAEAVKLYELQKNLETKGLKAAGETISEWEEEAQSGDASKALQRLARDNAIQNIRKLADSFDEPHPKLSKLRVLVAETLIDGGNLIIFAEYVDTVDEIVEFLTDSDISAKRFVGQSGMTRDEQQSRLDAFRRGDFDVLVATKVGEEGLDLPQVSRIIEYHPVSSGLREVQRAGRTGRAADGEVIILVNKDTMEEGMFYAAKKNKNKMRENLSELADMEDDIVMELQENQTVLQEHAKTLTQYSEENDDSEAQDEPEGQLTLDDIEDSIEVTEDVESIDTGDTFDSELVKIIVDSREMKSSIGRRLHKEPGIEVSLETLEVGDYILSNDCAAERKEVTDFLDTLTGGDRSLFEQLGDMVSAYDKPVLFLEGDTDELYSGRVHRNAINGALASLRLDFGVQIIETDSEEDTVEWMKLIAKREQDDSTSEVQAHGKKSTTTMTDQQEYIVSSFEDVGVKTARSLLDEFGTVEEIMSADSDELQEADGVGPKTASHIREVVTEEYTG